MDQPIVGNPGDPFATVASAPPGAPQTPSAAPGAPGSPPQFSVTQEQWDAQVAETERLKKLEQNVGWIGEALGDPAVRSRVMGLLAAGAAPNVSPQPAAPPVDPGDAIAARYAQRMTDALANGDMLAYGRANAEMGAEIAEARSASRAGSASSIPGLSLTAQNAIDNWFTNKRVDPRTKDIFPKLEGKLRDFVARTSPENLAAMVTNMSLIPALEAAFSKIFTDSYMESYSAAAASGRLAGSAPQNPPPYGAGTRGGAPQVNRGDPLATPEESEAETADDAAFLSLMEQTFGKGKFNVKGSRNGNTLVSEID